MASAGSVDVTLRVKGAAQSARAIRSTTKSLKSYRKSALKVVAVTGAVGFALKKLADANGKFEQGLAAVGAVTKATAKDMQALKDAAIQAGIATQFSPTEAVKGLNSLATAGQTAQQAIKTLIPVLDLAAGSLGQLGTGEAAMAVVGTLNTYAMSANKATEVTDKLLRITQLTNFQTKDFAAGLAKASAKTVVYGQSLDDTLIAMGLLRNANIDASSASTAYAMAVSKVATDTKALNTLNQLGASLYDKQTGKVRSFLDLVTELKPKLDTMGDAQRNSALKSMFGARSIAAYNAIAQAQVTVVANGTTTTLKGAEAIDHLRKNMSAAGGTAEGFKAKLLDTYEGQKTLLKGSLETLAVISGEEFSNAFRPFVENAIAGINDLIKHIKSMTSTQKKEIAATIIAWVKWTGIISGAMLAITMILGPLGKLIGLLGSIKAAIVWMKGADFAGTIGSWGGALSKLKGPATTAARLLFSIKAAALGAIAATAYAMKTSADRISSLRKDAELIKKIRNETATAGEYEEYRRGGASEGAIEQRVATGGRMSWVPTQLNLQTGDIKADETNLAKVQARWMAINKVIEEQLELRKKGKDGLQQAVVLQGKVVGIQKVSLDGLRKRAERLRKIADNIQQESHKQQMVQDSLTRQTETLTKKAGLTGRIADNAAREEKAVVATYRVISVGEKVLARARVGKAKREDQARANASIRRKPQQERGPVIRERQKMKLVKVERKSFAAPFVPGAAKMSGGPVGTSADHMQAEIAASAAAKAAKKQQDTWDSITGAVKTAANKMLDIFGSLTGALSGQLPAIMGSIGAALGSMAGPMMGKVGGIVGGMFDTLFGQSDQGKKAAAAMQGLAASVSGSLQPVFNMMIPIIGLLTPLFDALLTSLEPVIHVLLQILFPVLKWLGVIVTDVLIGLRYLYVGLLKIAQWFGADYEREIAQQEAGIRSQVAARNRLMDTTTETATAAVMANAEANQESAKETQKNANAVKSLNEVDWYNAARTAYGADTGIAGGMANDFISRPGQPLQKFSSADTLMGFNGDGPLGGGGGGATYEIGQVHIHGVDDPESFWKKIEEAIKFNVIRGGTALPTTNRWGGI